MGFFNITNSAFGGGVTTAPRTYPWLLLRASLVRLCLGLGEMRSLDPVSGFAVGAPWARPSCGVQRRRNEDAPDRGAGPSHV